MTTLSPGQIAAVAKEAGWPAAEIPLIVAITLGESGGRTDARGDVSLMGGDWGASIGLTQIRSKNSERGKGTTRDELANLDPVTNLRHALQIRRTQGFGAWTVFNTKAYMQYMGKALAGAAAPGSLAGLLPDLPNPLSGTADALGTIRNAVKMLTDGTLFLRGLMIVGGFYLMFLGVVVAFFGSSAGETTVKIGKTVAKTVATAAVVAPK